MSGKSSIQWTESTWNPVVGCKRVSAGCDHCYAFELHDKRHIAWKRGNWPTAPAQYHKPFSQVQLLPERLEEPLHWRKPRRVFVNSMSDLFHESVPFDFIEQVFEVMLKAEQHTFQVLTKRPQRMLEYMRQAEWRRTAAWFDAADWMPGNIWLGVSVENQQAADERIPLLLETPAAVRFLSCEPLIGPVSLMQYWREYKDCWETWLDGLDWVIVGGESGTHARYFDLDWARSLVEQCQGAGVACFVKQLGSYWADDDEWCRAHRDRHGGLMEAWPGDLQVREYPRMESAGETP